MNQRKAGGGRFVKRFAYVHVRAIVSVAFAGLAGFMVISFPIAFPSTATAAGVDPKVAVLSVAGPSTFDAKFPSSPSGQESDQPATVRPVIINSGAADATVAFQASLDDADGNCALSASDIKISTDQKTPFVLPPGHAAAPVLTMTLPEACAGTSGTLIVTGGAGVTPVALRFMLDRDVQESVYWRPVDYSLVAAAVYLIAMLLTVGLWRGRFGPLSDPVATGPSWSFSDSWLTNISAVGAILTAVLAATGFLSTVLPGTPTGRFVGLSLLFGGFIVVAPVIYSAASKWEWTENSGSPDTLVSVGRVWGVILAAGATIAGVFGELGTLLTLTITATGSDGPKKLIYALLAAAALIVIYYSVSFTLGVAKKDNLIKKGDNRKRPKTHRPVSGTL
jgi:hypothetical protein